MRKFTIYQLATALAIALANPVISQPDAGVTAGLVPQPLSTIYPNVPQQLNFTVTNFTSAAINPTSVDSIIIELRVNGTLAQTSFAATSSVTIAGNQSIDLINNTATDWSAQGLGLASQSVSICIKSRLRKNGADVDANSGNDDVCYTVTYSGDNTPFTYDFAIDSVKINLPHFLPGAYIKIPTFPSQLAYDLVNTINSADLFPGIPYSYDITVDGGAPTNIDATVSGYVSTPGVERHTVAASISLPLSPGPFDICISMVASTFDTDHANDEYCSTYNMGNPASVENIDANYGDVYYTSGSLFFKFNGSVTGLAKVKVFESSGREAGEYDLNTDINKEHQVDVSDLSTGVYIVTVVVENQPLSFKFSVN